MKIWKINKKNWDIRKKYFRKIFYILSGIVLVASICSIIVWGGRPYGEKSNEGDIAMKNIYAPFGFKVNGSINDKATFDLKNKAKQRVKKIYKVDTDIEKKVYKEVDEYFNAIIEFKEEDSLSSESKKYNLFKEKVGLDLSNRQIDSILNYDKLIELKNKTKEVIDRIFSLGFISSPELNKLSENNDNTIILYDKEKDTKSEVELSKILYDEEISEIIKQSFVKYFPDQKYVRSVLSFMVLKVIEPNIKFDIDSTKEKQRQVMSKVSEVYNKIFVKRNEQIVEKGQRINKKQIKLLNAMDQIQRGENSIFYILGIAGIIIVFTLLTLIYIYIYQPSLFKFSNFMLIGLSSLILVGISKMIIVSPLSSYLIPVASISMLFVILLNLNIAIVVTIFLSFIVGLVIGDGLTIAIVFFCGAFLSLFTLRNVKSRIKILQSAFIVSIVNFIAIIFLGLFQNLDYATFLTQGLWGIGNGFLSGLLVMGLLPVFEYIFNITTDISLLEQSDLNHPLLKKMILNAPGTYNHSLIVGNLSEAACEVIGANSLLARVSSYFHDIGKIEKPEYFSENQTKPESKHDKLTPDMSKLIIIKHVKTGIELAKEFKIKQAIIDIIEQHHGTGLVFYFFKRALDENMDQTQIDEEHYRYPGPKPQTKEAAVVLLADSVEAASRALSGPTPSRIKGLVRKVINNKFIDGQLDECDLTLKELNKIAEVFIRILTGVFHSRIKYPDNLQDE